MTAAPVVRAVAAVLLVVVASGCGDDGGARADDGLTVVATTDFLADLVGGIAGDAAEVAALVPSGVDPHRFSASTRDATSIREADLVVANGLGLEAQLGDTLEAAEEDGVPVLHLAEDLDPLSAGEDEAETDQDHGEHDPHVWLDPLRMADAAGIVAARLAEVEGEGGLTDEEWSERGEAYAQQLHAVHDEIVELLEAVPDARRQLVTDHDSLRYFAERYGFEVVGTFLPGTSTEAQPSTRAIAELADLVEERGIPAVFVDSTGASERLARTLVAEVGGDVEIVPVYTGGLGPEGSGAETLVGMLRTNAQRIVDGLG